MARPRVLILRAPGTNCDAETAFAFERAGGSPEVLHVNRLREDPGLLTAYQVLCFPGGFSYGDDIAAGRIFASQIQHRMADAARQFKDDGKLVLGICNGFQALLKSGLLFEDDPQRGPVATLTWNDSGRYTDRWVHLGRDGQQCVFLEGVERMYLPIAHAEGKFVARDQQVLQDLAEQGCLALRYMAPSGGESGMPSVDWNPNGSQANVAGVCDSTGRVFGLMPHPERHLDPTHHPRWTRGAAAGENDGFAIFQNAVRFFA